MSGWHHPRAGRETVLPLAPGEAPGLGMEGFIKQVLEVMARPRHVN